MSTLSVSAIQNTASPVTNVVLNADGSSTVALYNAGVAPTPTQTGTLWYDISGAGLVIWDGAAWVGVGGGSGTVTSVTGTAPIVVATGTTTPAISITAATTGSPGSIQLATAAENAAGTDATKAVTPAFSVPKDAAGMTGAAILPSGTDAQRAAIASPVAGMTRLNTDYTPDSLEVYNGTNWRQVAYVPNPTLPADLTISANTTLTNSTYVVNNLTINAGVTATLSSQSVVFICYGDVNIAGTIDANGLGPAGGFSSAANGGTGSPTIGSNIGAGDDAPPPYQPVTSLVGSGGTGGFCATSGSGNVQTVGGGGGGAVLIYTYKDAAISGTLTARGSNATNPLSTAPCANCGSGGGSGGSVVVHSLGSLTFSGTIDVSGGDGSNAVINGYAIAGVNGGAGGGGGYVILEGESGLTNTGTLTLTGGSPGSNSGAVDNLGGGSGGSYGGRGGAKGGGPGPGAGAAGVFATAGSPI